MIPRREYELRINNVGILQTNTLCVQYSEQTNANSLNENK